MGKVLETRRSETKERFEQLQKELLSADQLIAEKACVYATGSFGRGEASSYSDLDLFIVGLGEPASRELAPLDEICLKAELISATRKLDIPDFSGGGQYLKHYTLDDLIRALGKRDDDANNTFTARLLLLLESRPVLGRDVYDKTIDSVVAAYWRDYERNKDTFVPTFLANDILRLWRTFCVNYEAGTTSEPEEERAKRKLKNYKLRHSRLLTCYSGLLYLLATFVTRHTVRPDDVVNMARLSPTERLDWLIAHKGLSNEARQTARELLDHYERFLEATNHPKSELIITFLDRKKSKEHSELAGRLGDLTFEALNRVGQGSVFNRVLVV